MTIGPDQLRAHLERQEAQRRRAAAARAARLLERMPEAVALLRRYGARRVVLFGSLAVGSPRETSDVDLAVEGLDSPRYFEALGELMTLFGAPVDLVPLEEAPASLRERIAAEGRPL